MSATRQHARRIVGKISRAERELIAADPIAGIGRLGYNAVAEPALTSKRGAGGWCDGLSFTEHSTVLYAPTPGSQRQNFTLLHEVGHILVEDDDDALVWLADCASPDKEMERLCDEIASALVIPDTMLADVVGTGPVSGEHLKRLVAISSASGPACAIALATRLSSGAVFIVDRATARVVHAAVRGDDLRVYPWRDTDVPVGHPLLNLAPDAPTTGRSYWVDQWDRRQTYYVDAVATQKRIYAIFSVNDLWGVDRFHAGEAPLERSQAPRRVAACACGFGGTFTGWPCDVCGRQFCPRCGDCDCQRRDRALRPCTVCFLGAPATDLEDGVCSSCR